MTMNKSITAFMDGLIDYAGLFPPAQLPLSEAAGNFAAYRENHPQAFFLSRFICPAKKLPAFKDLHSLLEKGPAWRFSVLAGAGDSAAEHNAALGEGYKLVTAFTQDHPDRVDCDALETKIPLPLFSAADPAGLQDFFTSTAEVLAEAAPGQVEPWFEVHFPGNWPEGLAAACEALAAHNAAWQNPKVQPGGIKIRTGGVEAHLFPSCEQVAATMLAVRDAGLAFKATAGLHHPLRHFSGRVNTKMHGFFNVFGGAVLAKAHGLDQAALTAILEDEDAGSWNFDDQGLRRQDLSAGLEDIAFSRRTFGRSYGSCSFLEPVEDLEGFGLIG